MKKLLSSLPVFLFMFLLLFSLDIKATSEDSQYLKDAEMNERLDEESNNEQNVKPKTFASKSTGLTIPEEGSWDENKTKDIKDSSGKIVERRFYSSKNVLMEKRFYRYSGSTRIMDEKYLYWSDGKTLERKREYGYTSSNDSYHIIKTYKYRDDETREWILLYIGKTSDIYEKKYVYTEDGNWYSMISYYDGKTTNRLTKRLYYNGYAPNHVTHVAEYNSTGKVYEKVTYYDQSYSEGLKTKVIKYTGEDVGNKKVYIWYYDKTSQQLTNTTYYDETGKYIDFKTIWENGLKKERTYFYKDNDARKESVLIFDEQGIKLEQMYFANNLDNIMIKLSFFDEEEIVMSEEFYYSNGNLKEYIEYSDYNNKIIEYKEIYSLDKTGELWQEEYYDESGELESSILINGVDTATLTIDGESVEYSIEAKEKENIVVFEEGGIENELVLDKEDGNIYLNEENIGNIEELISEDGISLMAAAKWTKVRSINGTLNVSGIKTVVGIAAVVIGFTASKNWGVAVGIANVIVNNHLSKIYYTADIYMKKVKKGRQSTKYKYKSIHKFYKDSKRKKFIGQI